MYAHAHICTNKLIFVVKKKQMRHFYACVGTKKVFFFKFQYLVVGGKLNPNSFTHSNSRKIFQTKEMHPIALINSPCQKLAPKIKAFQSAFEVKDSAANGTCKQVNFLT